MTGTLTHQDSSPAQAGPVRFDPVEMTSGMVAGHSTWVAVEHRRANITGPIVLDMTVTIPMSLDDVTAVLWWLWDGSGCPLEQLTGDPAFTHRAVLETYLGGGGLRVEETLCHLANLTPADPDYADWQQLRAEVTRIYGPDPAGHTTGEVAR